MRPFDPSWLSSAWMISRDSGSAWSSSTIERSEGVHHREQAGRERAAEVALAEGARQQLAHPGPNEAGDDQLARLVLRVGQSHQGRPLADVERAEQRQRVANRLDPARQREERRVDEAEQVVAQRDVAAD